MRALENLRKQETIDMSQISFKNVSYNRLRDYINGRMMYFNCRVNPWEGLITCIGVFYRGFLCGGTLVSVTEKGIPRIETWYSRDDRAKIELLNKTEEVLRVLGYEEMELVSQKKWLVELLSLGWTGDGKILRKGLKNE